MTTLVKVAEEARDQFRFYAKEHRAKYAPGKPPMTPADEARTREKAIVNEEFADRIQAALDAHHSGGEILKLETIQDYRFGSLVKGERWAFARGLTINPTHLPAALDAMSRDGFDLHSVFGETTGEKIGFIFRMRKDPRVAELLVANNREIERRRNAERLMREFVDRVDAGEVRSTRTYNAFKAHLDNPYAE